MICEPVAKAWNGLIHDACPAAGGPPWPAPPPIAVPPVLPVPPTLPILFALLCDRRGSTPSKIAVRRRHSRSLIAVSGSKV